MPRNIESIKVIEKSVATISKKEIKAFYKSSKDRLPEINFVSSLMETIMDDEVEKDEYEVDNLDWSGVYSGNSFRCLLEICKKIKGKLKAVIMWEGHIIEGLSIDNGEVKHYPSINVKVTYEFVEL